MPGDCLPRREELARLQESPILWMGPELETTGAERHCTALHRAGTLDARHTLFEVVDL